MKKKCFPQLTTRQCMRDNTINIVKPIKIKHRKFKMNVRYDIFLNFVVIFHFLLKYSKIIEINVITSEQSLKMKSHDTKYGQRFHRIFQVLSTVYLYFPTFHCYWHFHTPMQRCESDLFAWMDDDSVLISNSFHSVNVIRNGLFCCMYSPFFSVVIEHILPLSIFIKYWFTRAVISELWYQHVSSKILFICYLACEYKRNVSLFEFGKTQSLSYDRFSYILHFEFYLLKSAIIFCS